LLKSIVDIGQRLIPPNIGGVPQTKSADRSLLQVVEPLISRDCLHIDSSYVCNFWRTAGKILRSLRVQLFKSQGSKDFLAIIAVTINKIKC